MNIKLLTLIYLGFLFAVANCDSDSKNSSSGGSTDDSSSDGTSGDSSTSSGSGKDSSSSDGSSKDSSSSDESSESSGTNSGSSTDTNGDSSVTSDSNDNTEEIAIDEKDIDDKVQQALKMGEIEVEQESVNNNMMHTADTDMKDDAAENRLAQFGELEHDGFTLVKDAQIQLSALRRLSQSFSFNLKTESIFTNNIFVTILKRRFHDFFPGIYDRIRCNPRAYYRTIDGSCNNLYKPKWGAAMTPQLREILPTYSDGLAAPRQYAVSGKELPSARVISNAIHKADGKSPRNSNLTMMVMQWGQFIDHDLVLTPVLKGANGSDIECCGAGNEKRPECFPIRIPDDDEFFNRTCMGMVRSAPVPNDDCEPGVREQMNQVTSYVDASAVYGSHTKVTNSLRTFHNGLLKIYKSDSSHSSQLPPTTNNKCTIVKPKEDRCAFAGDKRVNVVPSLGWSHTCFVREHNRIAKELARLNPRWTDETLFQQTRRIVGAMIQVINYKEYLPAILNTKTMEAYNLNLYKKYTPQTLYNPRANPSIFNAFAVAAFRFGHSQIADYQAFMSKKYTFTERKPIEATYHRPHMIQQNDGEGLDAIGRWLIEDPTPLADGIFGDGVRNLLFKDKHGISLDLPALNIQRGRDHGIPGYNHWRIHCDLEPANNTDEGNFKLPNHNEEQRKKLQSVYSDVDDIDLFAGAMTENLLPDSSVGPTFACLIGTQFKMLKIGDRFWHETRERLIRFTRGQLEALRNVTLARVLCDNFDIDTVQPDVFRVPGAGNKRVECDAIPRIDLEKWSSYSSYPDGRPFFEC